MVLERINPIGSEGPSRKREKSSPDSGGFSDMMVEKTRKVSEVDPEERKKRRIPGEEEDDEFKTESDKAPSPYDTSFYDTSTTDEPPPEYDDEETQGLPTSPHFWHDVSENQKGYKKEVSSKEDKAVKAKAKAEEKKLKVQEEKLKKIKTPKELLKTKESLEERKQSIKEAWSAKERFGKPENKDLVIPEDKTKDLLVSSKNKGDLEKIKELKKEEKALTPPPAPMDLLKDEGKKKEFEKEKMVSLQNQFTPPAHIAQAASVATEAVKASVPTDVHQLFTHMVGTVIQINQKGIERTQVILNSPNLAKSPFFGATVEVVKYSTAPNAYNIRLMGTPEAVNLFSANIDGLREAFDKGNFSFQIGRINAELKTEKPLFHRKESLDRDKGGQKDG